MKTFDTAPQRLFRLFALGLVLAVLLSLLPATALAQDPTPTAGGYYYVVRRGDTWSGIAWVTGIPVAQLKAANPTAIHPNDWLWAGDRLFIPARPVGPPTPPPGGTAGSGYWYQIKWGDTWYSVSRTTGVAVLDLWHANPSLLRPNRWLYAGQWLWVPGAATEAVEPTAPAGAGPTETPAPVGSPPPTAAPTPAPLPTATPVAAARPAATQPPPTPTIKPTVKPGQTAAAGATCPAGFAGYPDAITAYLKSPGSSVAGLTAWLTKCGAVKPDLGSVTQAAIQSKISKDVVIVLYDPADEQLNPAGTLLIYHSGITGYTLARRADGAGQLTVLKVADVNADGKVDVVWTDTTCGAHTCFATLFVESWDGKEYRDWIADEPTMAYPEYSFKDTQPGGSGDEIMVHGGIIASAGAGPQRAWTETYISPEGGPYQLFSQVYDASKCLYHHILDANAAFNQWTVKGFTPAIEAYQAAIADTTLEACGTIPDELTTLRDFARFRLVVSLVANGKASQAAAAQAAITTPALLGAANTFLDSYRSSGSIVQACREANSYATANPASWQFLADWGYANPEFTAADLCPLDR